MFFLKGNRIFRKLIQTDRFPTSTRFIKIILAIKDMVAVNKYILNKFNEAEMLNRKLFYIVVIVAISFIALGTSIAQETKEEKPVMKMKTMMSDSTNTMINNCMDKISSDEGMRSMMMQKMMDKSNGDEEGMMEMCKTMMDNPEMMKMMKKMMGENSDMMKDGDMHDKMMKEGMMQKDNDNSDSDNGNAHESHHKKDGNNEKE